MLCHVDVGLASSFCMNIVVALVTSVQETLYFIVYLYFFPRDCLSAHTFNLNRLFESSECAHPFPKLDVRAEDVTMNAEFRTFRTKIK